MLLNNIKSKNDSYPKEEIIYVTETCIKTQLQGLFDYTPSHLHKYLEKVIKPLLKKERKITEYQCLMKKV